MKRAEILRHTQTAESLWRKVITTTVLLIKVLLSFLNCKVMNTLFLIYGGTDIPLE